eukprot:2467621-Prymnesium_polylepis.1
MRKRPQKPKNTPRRLTARVPSRERCTTQHIARYRTALTPPRADKTHIYEREMRTMIPGPWQGSRARAIDS